MAVNLSRQTVDGVSVIVAEGSSGDVAIAIDYTDILNDIKANVANIVIHQSSISSNTANIALRQTIIAAQQTITATKVTSIESMAAGDHGIHYRQPHQWEGGRARFTTEANIGDDLNTITMTNISE